MRLTASAPGKLVLLGEYAVLDGAPALVLAVNRRARATLATTTGEEFTVDAPPLGISGARFRLTSGARVEWSADANTAAGLGLVTEAVQTSAAMGVRVPVFHGVLDTGEFFTSQHIKYGLGSSAAMAVALIGALHALAGRETPTLRSLVDAHRRLQRGRGSGVDIAAALHGGALVYRLDGPRATAEPARLPQRVAWRAVWTGRSSSTPALLRQVDRWREHEPARYDALVDELTQTVTAGVEAARADDAAGFVDAVRGYGALLSRLGTASGADIISREHREILSVAQASGVAYKTAGAGGGDIGVALSTDPDRLGDFIRRLDQAGYGTLDLAVDRQGLSVHTHPE